MTRIHHCLVLFIVVAGTAIAAADEKANFRRPATDAELRYWLQNMVWHHRFSTAEVTAASLERLGIRVGEPAVASFKASGTRLVPLA